MNIESKTYLKLAEMSLIKRKRKLLICNHETLKK